jgi:16S rRNA (adenine1518-N6/adenine1519-N6)-dimethyltransferase
VDSAVIRLDLFDAPDVGPAGEEAFERCVRAAFSQRRKTLVNSLGSLYGRDEARAALGVAGVDPIRRAETVNLVEFQRIAAALVAAEPVHGSGSDAL